MLHFLTLVKEKLDKYYYKAWEKCNAALKAAHFMKARTEGDGRDYEDVIRRAGGVFDNEYQTPRLSQGISLLTSQETSSLCIKL